MIPTTGCAEILHAFGTSGAPEVTPGDDMSDMNEARPS